MMKKNILTILTIFALTVTGCGGAKKRSSSNDGVSSSDSISDTTSVEEYVNCYFYNYDNSYLWNTSVIKGGDAYYNGETPLRASDEDYDYVFSGWDKPLTNIQDDTNFYAQYTATAKEKDHTYTITWVNFDDSILEVDTDVKEGEIPTYNGETPTRANDTQYKYTFIGWTPEIKAVDGDATYKATYSQEESKYTVRWYNDSNLLETDENVAYGTTPTYDGAEPTKAHYDFQGWDPEISPVTGDVDYKAVFTKHMYTITWKNYDLSVLAVEQYEYGTKGSDVTYKGETPTRPADENYRYEFIGWDVDTSTIYQISNDRNFVAQYKAIPNQITVTFKNYDGTVLSTSTVQYGETPTEYSGIFSKPATSQYYYYFTGWDKKIGPVYEDTTYTAQYYESIWAMNQDQSDGYECAGLVNKNYAGEVEVPATFLGEPVKRIYEYAFRGHNNVTKVTVPSSVEYIDSFAFCDMKSLKELVLPFVGRSRTATGSDSLFGSIFAYASQIASVSYSVSITQQYDVASEATFYVPSSLEKVTITDSDIQDYAFNHMTMIKTIDLSSDSVTKIGNSSFASCSSLSNVILGNSLKSVDSYAFQTCVGLESITLPESCTYFGTNSFYGCIVLNTFVALGATSYGLQPFDKCQSLVSYTGPVIGHLGTLFGINSFTDSEEVVTASGDSYYIPSSLTYVNIPKSFLGLTENMFYNCKNITEVVIGSGVTSIEEGVLANMAALAKLTVPYVGSTANETEASASTLLGYFFGQTKYNSDYLASQDYGSGTGSVAKYYIPLTLKEVTVNGGDLFYGAFYSIDGIEKVTLNNVETIEERAFYHCGKDGTVSIILNDGIKSIGEHAFHYSYATSIVIPDSVTTIEDNAFSNCEKVTSIIMGSGVTSLGLHAFQSCDLLETFEFKGNAFGVIPNSCFYKCGALKSIVVPEGITEIGTQAFDYCESMTSLTLPSTITKIGAGITNHTEALTQINFNGTKAQWEAINKSSNWKGLYSSLTSVVCSDGTIAL